MIPFLTLFLSTHTGYPVLDANGPDQNGFLIPQSTIRRGGRCSTAKAYLYSVRDRSNLHVVTFAHVTKVLFNQYREAIGVVFDRFGSRHKVFARKEVILSAGSINTPQLLMLSGEWGIGGFGLIILQVCLHSNLSTFLGIGPRADLNRIGVPVIADLPVGRNLQDHIFPYGLNFVATAKRPKGEFWTHIEARVHTLPNLISNIAMGRGPISSNGGLDAMGFVRTSYANRTLPDLPDYQINFLSGCLSSGE